ncbi:hypothetical protein AVEN_137721-1 [Araneus ventricosus]|uniref:Uncharacterized protein n=1 Tax=Araneus ventricosus TaxID=182803 RepID=A0A4Y2JDP7_ARAVE|nr:hypothetical protein AVEN_137721-1 [Araneus ventricosus]
MNLTISDVSESKNTIFGITFVCPPENAKTHKWEDEIWYVVFTPKSQILSKVDEIRQRETSLCPSACAITQKRNELDRLMIDGSSAYSLLTGIVDEWILCKISSKG